MNFSRLLKSSFILKNIVSLDKCAQNATCLRFYCEHIQAESSTEHNEYVKKPKLEPTEIIHKIFQDSKDKHLYCRANVKIIDVLRNYKIGDKDIIRLLSRNVELLVLSEQDLQERLAFIMDFGFKEYQALNFLASHMNVTEPKNLQNLRKVIAEIRITGISEKYCKNILLNNESLIVSSPQNIKQAFKMLKSFLTNTDALTAAVKCPNVLTDDPVEIKAKIEYTYNVMGISRRHMVNCNIFHHSLKDIIMRHKFLEKRGLYTKADPLQDITTVIDGGNPTYKSIFCKGLESFCMGTAHSSLDEFLTFKELFDIEEEETRKSEDDDNNGEEDCDEEDEENDEEDKEDELSTK